MSYTINSRINIIGIILGVAASAVLLRLGYLQIIKHDDFSVLAAQTHLRKFTIAPRRGNIYLQDRGELTPVAINRNLKTVYADSRYIFDLEEVLSSLREVLGKDYRAKIESADGYVVLERVVSYDKAQKLEEQQLSGIGLSDNYVRTYPEGPLAAAVLGFVNADSAGQYGVEGALNEVLAGQPGLFNAATDTRGIPIATGDNVRVVPVDGRDVVLTIDRNLQAKAEAAIKHGVETTGAESAHALVMEANTGRILAMANYPSFNPNKFGEVSDYRLFSNAAATEAFEPGSGFKIFTMAAGLESGVVSPEETYYDAGSVTVGDRVIKNAEGAGGNLTMTDVITRSVNTGVVYVLEQLGGGSINSQGKQSLYEYFTERFRLDQPVDLAQTGLPELYVNTPDEVGDVNYANMTFGQGVTTTMVRMLSSIAAVVNGGTLYEPQLVDYQSTANGEIIDTAPEVVAEGIVSAQTSSQIRAMMATVVEQGGGYSVKAQNPGYAIGGKTGTAQIPSPEGGYFLDRDIGTFTGFVPLEQPEYVMMVRIDAPGGGGFAGSAAAGPIFGDIMQWLLKYKGVPPS